MHIDERTFTTGLASGQRTTHIVRRGKIIESFSVQFEIFVQGEWHIVMRFDDAHDTPHQHIYHLHRAERKFYFRATTSNLVLTYAQEYIKANHRKLRQDYLSTKRSNV